MSQIQFKIKRLIKFRENIVAEVPFLQDIRENVSSDVDSVASKNNPELPDAKNVVLFKRRIELNENVIAEVPVVSPKRDILNLTIPENINEITEEPEVKSPEIEFDEIYDSLTNATIDIEDDVIENLKIEDEKIDPVVVDVKFEEILQSYENKPKPISLDAFNSSKQSKIPIFRQLSETGNRILSRAPRRRSLDNKEFNDTVQSKIKTFEQFENKIEDSQVADDTKDGIVNYECVKVENCEDECLGAVENVKESLVFEEQIQSDSTKKLSDRRPVLAKFLNRLERKKNDKNILAQEKTTEKLDNTNLRRKGKSGIPLLKKTNVNEYTKYTDVEINQDHSLENHNFQLETNNYQDNTELIAKEDNAVIPEEFVLEDAICDTINTVNTKPIIQQQVKEPRTDVGNVDDVKKVSVESNQENKYEKPQTEYQKFIENKKHKKEMGFKPVLSKIAIFEDRKKQATKFQKIIKTESNTDHKVKISDHTTATPEHVNSKRDIQLNEINDFQIDANNIRKDDSTNKIIEVELCDPKINEADTQNNALAEDDTNICESHNHNVNFNEIRPESISNLNTDKIAVTLDPIQQMLKVPKETNANLLAKPKGAINKSDKDIIRRPLAIFTLKLTEEKPTLTRAKSLADIELGTKIQGKVELAIKELFVDKAFDKPVGIKMKERPRRNSVSEKIALFEKKITPVPIDDKLLTAAEDKFKMAHITPLTNLDDATERVKNPPKDESESERKQKLIDRLINVKEAMMPYEKYDIMPFYRMRDGNKMPVIALGTALLLPDLTKYIVAAAIDLGYRAIDTAYIYGNERQVGEGIKMKIEDGTIKREDIFVISKLWNTYHAPALVERACRESLETLGLDYVDLYLIHQPMSFKEGSNPTPMVNNSIQYSEDHDFVDAWKAMMELKSRKLVKSIGVSNFNIQQLQTLINETGETPAVNQIECHPYLTQRELSDFCAKNHIAVSAYSVLGSKGTPAHYKSKNASAVIDDPDLRNLAKRSGLRPTQILLRYQLERGHCLVVKSSTPEHLLMNLSCLNMKLNQEQVGLLNQLNRDQRNFDFRGMGDTHKNYPFHAFE